MKSTTSISRLTNFLVVVCAFTACQTKIPGTGITTLNIIPALQNEKEFRLSELVDSVEYVKLETRPECLISNASRVIGEKYIVVLNRQPDQVFLFDRSGKFIRKIGQIGKGPGEYSHPTHVDLSPDEERILVADSWPMMFLEYSVDGSLITSLKTSNIQEGGPFYLDNRTILFTQIPFPDSLNFPTVLSMNLDSGEKKTLLSTDYKRNPERNSGYCLTNDLYYINGQVIYKNALNDTIYKFSPGSAAKPIFSLNIGTNTAKYICMSEAEVDSYDHVAVSCLTGNYLLLVGNHSGRFHLVRSLKSGETFKLLKLKGCRGENDYSYGIINDLTGTGPYWFWYNANIRNNVIPDFLQIADLKELVKTECFLNADLKTNRYRDQLKKLVEESSENENPIIRILHLK